MCVIEYCIVWFTEFSIPGGFNIDSSALGATCF
jgi:hypothetical protein